MRKVVWLRNAMNQTQALFLGLTGLLWVDGLVASPPLTLRFDSDTVCVNSGQRVVVRYRYRDAPFKPYVDTLFSPLGLNPLLDAPKDHLHHHGLMFALKVDGVNFWEEQQAPGRQNHQSFVDTVAERGDGIEQAGFAEEIVWTAPGSNAPALMERRALRVIQLEGQEVTLLNWESTLATPPGRESVTLSGAHYHGLGLRFIEAMNATGLFRNSEGRAGEIFRGEERLTPAAWCAYTVNLSGKPLTVAMFGHPENIRQPAIWFTMANPFAYLSATLNLHKEPLMLNEGKPLRLSYLTAVWDGNTSDAQIRSLYQWWVNYSK